MLSLPRTGLPSANAAEFGTWFRVKHCRVREGAPHARTWGAEHHPFFDPIGALRVVGCFGVDCHGLIPPQQVESRLGYATFMLHIIPPRSTKCNPHVALSFDRR